MDNSTSLQRLLTIRRAEEGCSQSEMERAVREQQHLEAAQATAQERRRCASALVSSSAQTGELMDRVAGLQEMKTSDRLRRMFREKIDEARMDTQHKRQELLARRLARRQVETLIDAKLAQSKVDSTRKTQSALDDWHRSQRVAAKRKANPSRFKSDISLTD